MRLPDADRNALARLAAHADTAIELHVVADHGNAVHRVRPVADQHGALDGPGHLAVLDHIGFDAAEHEFPARDVHLAAAEGDGVNALLHRGDDFLGRLATAEHVGVRHARHGLMRVGFPAPISGRLHAHEPGVQTVLHVAYQPA